MQTPKASEYREKARECRRQAEQSETKEDKVRWLDLANRWDQSAEKVEALNEQSDPLGAYPSPTA